MGLVHSPKKVPESTKARPLEGTLEGLQEYVNKKSATGIGDEAVTQKKKSSDSLPKQD